MRSKLLVVLVVASTTTAACASKTASGPGSGGATTATGSTAHATSTTTTATSASSTTANATGASGTSSAVTVVAATTGTGPTMTCDSIGVCQLPGNTNPAKDCVTCAVVGTMSMFTNGGACRPAFDTAFGNDGQCTTGGFAAACTYLLCTKACLGTSGMFDTQKKWDCYCTNDQMGVNSSCNTAQTDTATCLGALEANMPAYQAETAFEDCLYGATGTCVASCLGGG